MLLRVCFLLLYWLCSWLISCSLSCKHFFIAITNIDNLHADNALLKAELDDAKCVIKQLKSQHAMELEEWQKDRLELLEKSMHLNKDLVEKEEELDKRCLI